MTTSGALPVLLLLLGTPGASASIDPCVSAVPASLAEKLAERFPGYRLPRRDDEAQDIPAAEIASARKVGLGGCFTQDSGDFDGDGRKDFVLLLPRTEPSTATQPVQLVVALNRAATWEIEALPAWLDGIEAAYASSVGPGTYKRTDSMAEPLEPGERVRLTLRHQGVCAGKLEATSVVYARERGTWAYVWVSN